MLLTYLYLLSKGTKKEKMFDLSNSVIVASFGVIDSFYFLFEYKFNTSREYDKYGQYRPDVFLSSFVRYFSNLWFYCNFIYYGCSKEGFQLDNIDALEGLEHIDIDTLRKMKSDMSK